jgi:hypothetical protein
MRTKLFGLMMVCLLGGLSSRGQIPIVGIIEDVAKQIVMAIDLKVQELQNETIGLQEAQKELENALHLSELGDIASWLQQQKELYQGYYQELWQIKTAISTYNRVKDMIDKEALIAAQYKSLSAAIGRDGHFTAAEAVSMVGTLTGILNQSIQNIGEIETVINAFLTQMPDADRLRIIDQAATKVDQNYTDLQVFGQRSLILSLNRARNAGDAAAVRALYGLP